MFEDIILLKVILWPSLANLLTEATSLWDNISWYLAAFMNIHKNP